MPWFDRLPAEGRGRRPPPPCGDRAGAMAVGSCRRSAAAPPALKSEAPCPSSTSPLSRSSRAVYSHAPTLEQ